MALANKISLESLGIPSNKDKHTLNIRVERVDIVRNIYLNVFESESEATDSK